MLTLDGTPIFNGEIRKASGTTSRPENCCEIILFTDSTNIMERIDAHDWVNTIRDEDPIEEEQQRPMTATKEFTAEDIASIQQHLSQPMSFENDDRPMTAAIR